MKNQLEEYLDILNEVSVYLEDNANFDEQSQIVIRRLDKVIDWLYDMIKETK